MLFVASKATFSFKHKHMREETHTLKTPQNVKLESMQTKIPLKMPPIDQGVVYSINVFAFTIF